MATQNDVDQQPALQHVEPVLAVSDILKSVTYWHEVLGFPDHWTWGEPPNHGGVSWNGAAFIQFSLNPKLAAISEGHSIWIRVKNLDALFSLHQKNGAMIVMPIENKPWGFAEYTVQDINGHYVHFSMPASNRKTQTEEPGRSFNITGRTPTTTEYKNLMVSVGWSDPTNHADPQTLLSSVVYAVTAEDSLTREAVGCALLFGDQIGFYYVKDVMVHPLWQGQGIGTALMQHLTHWIEANAPDKSTVGLFTGEHLAPFYRQFGFIQACGMYRSIDRQSKKA
ncbi:MAG: GNAT family N-acetyltransferase [Bacteroidota bacterium]